MLKSCPRAVYNQINQRVRTLTRNARTDSLTFHPKHKSNQGKLGQERLLPP